MRRASVYSGLPAWVFVAAVLGAVFVVLPLAAMASRVRWSDFFALITSESSLAALQLSLKTSTAATVLCVVLGVPMALVLARTSFPGQRIARSLMLLPLEIYLQRESDADAAVALSLVLVVIAMLVVAATQGRSNR